MCVAIQLEYSFVVAHYTELNSRKKMLCNALTSKCDCEFNSNFRHPRQHGR